MRTTKLMAVAVLTIALGTLGCTTYYRITDPASGRAYYAEEFKRSADGTLQFKDAKSGAAVTLRSSEVLEITKEEFSKNTSK
jgi:hypothetical protein